MRQRRGLVRHQDVVSGRERAHHGHLLVCQGDEVSVARSTDRGICKPHRLNVHVVIRPARDGDVPVGARYRQARCARVSDGRGVHLQIQGPVQ